MSERTLRKRFGWWLMGWPTGMRKPSRFVLRYGPYRWGARIFKWAAPVSERMDVQQLRDLLDKATPRPWFQSCPPWQPDGRFVYEGSEDPHGRSLVADFDPDPEIPDVDSGERDANAALIVATVNSLPALLARLVALEEVAEAAGAYLDAGDAAYLDETSERAAAIRAAHRLKLRDAVARLREAKA